ncbi:hypothetical protein [Acinetobacter ursingii]|uniref:hypothetical protein n=1 Tax=Acinetobacter ursingii TaxID=108980 RepID=UPI00148F33BF|nr:hypothetical protein [Acinetobacter ursingii]
MIGSLQFAMIQGKTKKPWHDWIMGFAVCQLFLYWWGGYRLSGLLILFIYPAI